MIAAREKLASRREQIWFVPYPQGDTRKVTNGLNIYQAELSVGTNGKLAVLQGHLTSEIHVAPDSDVTHSRLLFKGVEPAYEAVDGLAWMPNGYLLYSSYIGDGQGIWEIDGDGSKLRQLTTPDRLDSVDRAMSTTRGGRYIVFQSNRSGSFQIWRANADGSDLRQLTTTGENFQPSVSPDSQWIVYHAEVDGKPMVGRISTNGGEAAELTRGRCAVPQVSPDGKYIACFESLPQQPVRLAILPFNGGEPVKTFDIPDTIGSARQIRWTPDSKSVMYRDSIQGLWQQRLDEKSPRRFKGLEDAEIYQFAWSIDGKNLAYSTGARMQEIILLETSK